MKNANVNAAIYMATPVGLRIHAWKLCDKLEVNMQTVIEEMKQYVAPLVDMYEIAEEVAMGECSDDKFAPFGMFGDWFAGYMRENNKFPEQKVALENMSNLMFMAFTRQMTGEQDKQLQRRLAAEVAEYGDE